MAARQYLFVRASQSENLYGPFTNEILTSEGLMGFKKVDIDDFDLERLQPDDLVILTRCFLRKAEVEALYAAVERGLRLVCFQPSPRMAKRFGLVTKLRVQHPGCVKIHPGYPGAGLPIQTHVPVALYDAPNWKIAADTVATDWAETGFPAVVHNDIGKGKVSFFFYDLPLAVARIRFGNPELASYCTTGLWSWGHAFDLFTGQVDDRVKHLPQADFHGQFLAKILTDLCAYPLVRLWYYPESQNRTAAIFESDDDMSSPDQFRQLSDSLLAHNATATFYLMKNTHLTEAQVAELRSKGHTFAPHVNTMDRDEEFYFGLLDSLAEETRLLKKRFGDCSPSIQCHCAPWRGYADLVPKFMEHGYRLLFAYMSAPAPFMNRFLCGSGRPIRFCGLDGKILDSWQQPVLCYDDTIVLAMVRENRLKEILDDADSLIRQSLDNTHSAIGILSHPISFATYSRPYIEHILDNLSNEGVPIFNGDQWCDFLDRRSAIRTTEGTCCHHELQTVIKHIKGKFSIMVPLANAEERVEVTLNDLPLEGRVYRRLEQDYLFVDLEGDGHPCALHVHRVD